LWLARKFTGDLTMMMMADWEQLCNNSNRTTVRSTNTVRCFSRLPADGGHSQILRRARKNTKAYHSLRRTADNLLRRRESHRVAGHWLVTNIMSPCARVSRPTLEKRLVRYPNARIGKKELFLL
jgi:hypothetical protein